MGEASQPPSPSYRPRLRPAALQQARRQPRWRQQCSERQREAASPSTSQTCRSTTLPQRKSPASTSMASGLCNLYGVKKTARSSPGPQPRPACASSGRQPPALASSTSPANNPIPGAKSSFETATRSGRKPPRGSRAASCTKDFVSDLCLLPTSLPTTN
jgi:hypothetical protein